MAMSTSSRALAAISRHVAIAMRMAQAALCLAVVPAQAEPQAPAWMEQLGYRPTDLITIRAGPSQMPLVQVDVSGVSRWLLFDTGNMVGLSLTTSELTGSRYPSTRRGGG
jgi:hypothetical protein